jgi:hypothetical protein
VALTTQSIPRNRETKQAEREDTKISDWYARRLWENRGRRLPRYVFNKKMTASVK